MNLGCDCTKSNHEDPDFMKIYVGSCSVADLSLMCYNITDIAAIPFKIVNSKIVCKKPIGEDITIVSLKRPIAIDICSPNHKICGTN